LRIVQEEHQRLLAESGQKVLEKDEEIRSPECESVDKKQEDTASAEEVAQVISTECSAEKPVVAQEPLEEDTEVNVESKTASVVPKKGKKKANKKMAAAVEQQKEEQVVEQITEVMAKISVDVQQTQPQPRDSANTSPAEAMLASPTISHDSDTHSVVSFLCTCFVRNSQYLERSLSEFLIYSKI